MIELTKKQFQELWSESNTLTFVKFMEGCSKLEWLKIKKTALEEAREFVKMFDGSVGQDAVIKCSQLYEQAIKEAQENK